MLGALMSFIEQNTKVVAARPSKSIVNNSPPPQADTVVGSSEPGVARLANLISAHTPYDGSFALRLPSLHAVRYSQPNTELVHAVSRPVLCIVAQGAKTV